MYELKIATANGYETVLTGTYQECVNAVEDTYRQKTWVIIWICD